MNRRNLLWLLAIPLAFLCASFIPHNRHGQMVLQADTTMAFSVADTYQKVEGDWGNGHSCEWELDNENNRLIYHGPDGNCHLIVGVSELSVNVASDVTYGMYLNGTLVPGAETFHTFPASARVSTIAITRILELDEDDYIEVWAKSTETNTAAIRTLMVTVWGER